MQKKRELKPLENEILRTMYIGQLSNTIEYFKESIKFINKRKEKEKTEECKKSAKDMMTHYELAVSALQKEVNRLKEQAGSTSTVV